MGELDTGHDVADRVNRQLWFWIPGASLIGAVVAAAAGALTGANIRHQPGFGWTDAVTICVYFPVVSVLIAMSVTRRSERVKCWLLEDRPPSPREQRDTLALPWHCAADCMLGWLGAVAIWSVLTGVSHSAGYTIRVAASIFLGGLTTCGLTYLIAEWTCRPIAALALAGSVPERAVVPGVRIRLLLAWAIGADVFLLMIGLTFVGRPAHDPPSATAIWFIIGAGFVAGTLVLYVAGRSLVTPLLELRRSVAQVQRGDLDVKVAVNDGGELGLLQAGFNQMVSGLRERRTLEDLFGRHVGEEVAQQAMEHGIRGDLRGERCEVGVVFVDLIGSTAMAQSRSPEAVLGLLNSFFATVVRVVAAEGGWVNKFEGDGALCVFGAPVARPDSAVRALRTARTLRQELLALVLDHPELDAGIGVSAGSVVAGNVGAQQRYEYTVIGTPVNEAARLTDAAKGRLGRVLASDEAVARAGAEAGSWLVAEEMHLRGHPEPILVYEPRDNQSVEHPVG